MLDRNLSVPLLPRYIRSYEDAATRQRYRASSNDTEHQRPTAVPKHGSRSAGIHYHRSGHVGEVPSEST